MQPAMCTVGQPVSVGGGGAPQQAMYGTVAPGVPGQPCEPPSAQRYYGKWSDDAMASLDFVTDECCAPCLLTLCCCPCYTTYQFAGKFPMTLGSLEFPIFGKISGDSFKKWALIVFIITLASQYIISCTSMFQEQTSCILEEDPFFCKRIEKSEGLRIPYGYGMKWQLTQAGQAFWSAQKLFAFAWLFLIYQAVKSRFQIHEDDLRSCVCVLCCWSCTFGKVFAHVDGYARAGGQPVA